MEKPAAERHLATQNEPIDLVRIDDDAFFYTGSGRDAHAFCQFGEGELPDRRFL